MKTKLFRYVGLASVAVALTQSVQATLLTGNIGFSGAANLNTGSAQTASTAVSWVNTVVSSRSGSFANVTIGKAVTQASPWNFNSGTINSFWSVGKFTFNLASSTILSQDSLFLNVVLVGTVVATGYENTTFTGTFQLANPSANGASQFTQRFSFGAAPTNSVPDGGSTLLFLGAACGGLMFIRRKHQIIPA